ncbi:MAG TPA: hypothetical protein EYP59_07020 [Thiotrichaceae bacterium]|nr:hypothetical protein [Thiotrichaceae bacterium]
MLAPFVLGLYCLALQLINRFGVFFEKTYIRVNKENIIYSFEYARYRFNLFIVHLKVCFVSKHSIYSPSTEGFQTTAVGYYFLIILKKAQFMTVLSLSYDDCQNSLTIPNLDSKSNFA